MLTILTLGSNARADSASKASADTGEPLAVQRLEVNVVRSVPPQVSVRVHGVVLNGCTVVDAAAQHRDGRVIKVTILTHSLHRVCTMVARLVDETIQLKGDFAPGAYTLEVNGQVAAFQI
jgi:hypothetical protein